VVYCITVKSLACGRAALSSLRRVRELLGALGALGPGFCMGARNRRLAKPGAVAAVGSRACARSASRKKCSSRRRTWRMLVTNCRHCRPALASLRFRAPHAKTGVPRPKAPSSSRTRRNELSVGTPQAEISRNTVIPQAALSLLRRAEMALPRRGIQCSVEGDGTAAFAI